MASDHFLINVIHYSIKWEIEIKEHSGNCKILRRSVSYAADFETGLKFLKDSARCYHVHLLELCNLCTVSYYRSLQTILIADYEIVSIQSVDCVSDFSEAHAFQVGHSGIQFQFQIQFHIMIFISY